DNGIAGRFNNLSPRADALKVLAGEFSAASYVGLALRFHADGRDFDECPELVFKIIADVCDEGIEGGIRRRFSGHESVGLLCSRDRLRGHYEEGVRAVSSKATGKPRSRGAGEKRGKGFGMLAFCLLCSPAPRPLCSS